MRPKTSLYIFLLCMTAFACNFSQAQDPHLSQYFTSPMTLNPALVGKDVPDWRAMVNYRSQWWSAAVAPFTTTSASLEKNFQSGSSGKSSLGIGFNMLSDASNSGLLKNNYLTLGVAYNIALDAQGNSLFGIGLEGAYANRMLDASKFEFQSQFGSMGFQRSVPSGDPVNVLSNNYWDMNVGAHLSSRQRTWGYNLGAAVFHASRPVDGSFSNATYNIDRRFSLQAGIVFYLHSKDELHTTSTVDFQGQNSIVTLGAVYKLKFVDNIDGLNIGLFNRFNDALYPYLGLELKNFLIGASYDIVTSQVKNTSVQSMEFSFAWHFGSPKKFKANQQHMLIF
jgi:type IX secretion system PorP/SprF family membrane protein